MELVPYCSTIGTHIVLKQFIGISLGSLLFQVRFLRSILFFIGMFTFSEL